MADRFFWTDPIGGVSMAAIPSLGVESGASALTARTGLTRGLGASSEWKAVEI